MEIGEFKVGVKVELLFNAKQMTPRVFGEVVIHESVLQMKWSDSGYSKINNLFGKISKSCKKV